MHADKTLRLSFERDDYLGVIGSRECADQLSRTAFKYVASSLALLGMRHEAQRCLTQIRPDLSCGDIIEIHMHFLRAYLKAGERSACLSLLRQNSAIMRSKVCAQSATYQALSRALLAFASGRLPHAVTHARAAQTSAASAQDVYAGCLADEVLGPSLVMMGAHKEGFAALERAIIIARKLGRQSTLVHLQHQGLLLQTRYAKDPIRALTKITRNLSSEKAPGARASLHFEALRLHLLLGAITEARQSWRAAASLLNPQKPGRYRQILRLRLAALLLAESRPQEALVIAEAVLEELSASWAMIPRAECLDLVEKAALALGEDAMAVDAASRKQALLRRSAYVIPDFCFRPVHSAKSNLNQRQIALVEALTSETVVSAHGYAQSHSISMVTAFRDLSELVSLGYLHRRGRARATHYVRS